ncbi:MAG: esterase-like activity of phytase family protein [Rhodospirillales bacterium]
MNLRRLIPALMLSLFLPLPQASAESIAVAARQIPLTHADPALIDTGALIFRGGLHLTSDDSRFGGFSGLGISADGSRMISVSDTALTYATTLSYDKSGNLSGIGAGDLNVLADPDGKPLTGKRWSDAEAMSPGVEGEIIIAFERDHRLWRYDPGALTPRILKPPVELADMPGNHGIESLTLLNDGRLLAIAEGRVDEPDKVAWVSNRGGWDVLTYHAEKGFRPTGAATLPDGNVVVLERFYTPRAGVRIKIKRIPVNAIEAAAGIRGSLLATLAPPMNVDNFEGIEAIRGQDGKTYIYVISDNNFNPEQRTLLLMFELRAQ